jgi:DNA-binding SARP family transcriptional activator
VRRQIVPMARVRMPVAHGCIRPRLHRTLDGARANRLALIVAPAGSGKTTLLAHWARTQTGVVAWYRADTADAGVSGIAQCMATALRCAIADDHPARAFGPVHRIEDVAELVEAIDEQVVLIVDDVHELAGSTPPSELEQLLLLAPPNLMVVLGSRVVPEINLARSELSQPVLIAGDDLRFRSWEVEELFRDFHGEPLRPDDAAALARRTDGWAAALQLFHLATHGRTAAERSRAVRLLTGPSRYAKDYLSAQVLAGLPDELRFLLHRTCVFDVVTAARCDALLGGSRAQKDLEELERRQALTTTDDGSVTFRYHEVLRSHLETALREDLGEAGAREWYCRAAEILEEEGAVVEALRARCCAGDWTGAQRLLDKDGERLAADCTSDWAELLPRWLSQGDPWVALAEARRLLEDGQFAAAEGAARRADDQFTDPTGRELCRAVIRTAGAWRAGPQLVDARWADILRAATQRNPLAQAARAHTLDSPFADVVERAALLLAGDHQGAEVPLRRRAARPEDDPRAALADRLIRATYAVFRDPRPDSLHELDASCAEAERRGFTWLARVSSAIVLISRGEPAGLQAADELAAGCATRGDSWAALLIRACIVVYELRTGVPDLDRLDAFVDACRALEAGVLEAWARCLRALVVAAEERPDAEAEARAAESFARSAGVPGALAIAYAALALARADDGEELRQLAESTSHASGFDVQPWLWLRSAASLERADRDSRPAAAPPATRGTVRSLELTCFGPFRLKIAGVEPALGHARPRARTLLRLLALHAGHPVHRERLADTLWGELGIDAAMHNLQVTISSLRRTLQPAGAGDTAPLIARDGDTYRLVLGQDAHCDVREFDAQLSTATHATADGDPDGAAAALRRALEVYSGDLLPEEGPAEWVLTARERYRTLAADAASALAALELQRGHPSAAAVAAGRGVHIDRYHDGCWRTLIRAHRIHGNLAAAERAQRAYRTVLDSLGLTVEPEARTDLIICAPGTPAHPARPAFPATVGRRT